jgi:ABC-type multidrug transport system ATPase subunit
VPTTEPEPVVAALETRELTKAYGDLVALAPLCLTIGAGERVVLVGTNGSGKTTLLRMLSGLLEPSGGEAVVAGDPAGSIDARAALSYLPDDPVLYDDLSLAEHVEFVARLHDTDGWEERSAYLVDRLELTSRLDELPARFSRGLRQKTSLVLGLVRPFEVLVVDEPFVGLDQSGKAALLDLLDDAADSGATVLVATHQMDFVDRATRCIALRDGALTHDGPADAALISKLLG